MTGHRRYRQCCFLLINAICLLMPQVYCLDDPTLPTDLFYPFGTDVGDSVVPPLDDTSVGPIPLASDFPLHNASYVQLYVSQIFFCTDLFLKAFQIYHNIMLPKPLPFFNEFYQRNIMLMCLRNVTKSQLWFSLFPLTLDSNASIARLHDDKTVVERTCSQCLWSLHKKQKPSGSQAATMICVPHCKVISKLIP